MVRAKRLELLRLRHQILSLARLPFRHARILIKSGFRLCGDSSRARTADPLIKSQMLYQLS